MQIGVLYHESRAFLVESKLEGASKNSIKQMMARQKQMKKRSLHGVNEHFELVFNAASAALVNY